jgi:regulator of nucleoside diphosphate kinase
MIFRPNQRVAHPSGIRESVTKEHRKRARKETRHLIISADDHTRLEALINVARRDSREREDYLEALEGELRRARVVPSGDVPAEVVTMNSVVQLRDLESDEMDVYELVYPDEADMEFNRISVLAPIGTAILGYRVGDVIEWPVPAGVRRFVVQALLDQPVQTNVP